MRRRRRFDPRTAPKRTRINRMIRARQVRVIDADGGQLGIMESRDALRVAEEAGLDLVEVASKSDPPVCRVMDYGKYLYQEKKKQQEAKRKQKTYSIKEVKFRPTIDTHDFETKMKRVVQFLEDGDKVKITIRFRGREMARQDLGMKLLRRVVEEVGVLGVVESSPQRAGRLMHQVISPPRKGTSKKAREDAGGASAAPQKE